MNEQTARLVTPNNQNNVIHEYQPHLQQNASFKVIKLIKTNQYTPRNETSLKRAPHRYGNSRAIWDHTVLPATRQR